MDVLLLGFIAGYTFGGFRTGLVRRLAGLLFLALSFVLGAYLRAPLGTLIAGLSRDIPQSYGEMVGYIFVFPVVIAGLHLATGSVLKNVAVSGMTREVDQALGAIFGFLEAVLILSALIVILDTYLGPKSSLPAGSWLQLVLSWRDAVNDSTTAHLLRDTTVPFVLTVLGPLLPSDVRSIVPLPGNVPGIPALPSGLPGIPGLPSGLPGIPGLPAPSPTR